MLEYIRRQLAGPDNFIITVTTPEQTYTRCGIISADEIGIVIEFDKVGCCLPWSAILEIRIED